MTNNLPQIASAEYTLFLLTQVKCPILYHCQRNNPVQTQNKRYSYTAVYNITFYHSKYTAGKRQTVANEETEKHDLNMHSLILLLLIINTVLEK